MAWTPSAACKRTRTCRYLSETVSQVDNCANFLFACDLVQLAHSIHVGCRGCVHSCFSCPVWTEVHSAGTQGCGALRDQHVLSWHLSTSQRRPFRCFGGAAVTGAWDPAKRPSDHILTVAWGKTQAHALFPYPSPSSFPSAPWKGFLACPHQPAGNHHWITEGLRWAGTSGAHLVQPVLQQGHPQQVVQDHVQVHCENL